MKLRDRIRLLCTCGYVPDPPTDEALRTMRRVARVLVWLQIGKVDVRGLHHLDSCGPPRLFAPTHGHYLDPFVLGTFMPDRVRSMTARGLMQAGGGLMALLLSRWGAFCTDLDAGKGRAALAAAVRILASGQSLLMFPEGWANMDGVVDPFKRGPVSVARMAAAKRGEPIPIVPVYLRYGRYPGSWIRKLWPPLQYLFVLFGWMIFRRGVRVVIGKPLLTSELPRDSSLAAEELRRAVLALDPEGSELRFSVSPHSVEKQKQKL